MKLYLESFRMPTKEQEDRRLDKLMETAYCNDYYPFRYVPDGIKNIDFSNITILYGGNGSGKSTVLNIIAETLGVVRSSEIYKNDFFIYYAKMCSGTMNEQTEKMKIITSNDVFSQIFLTRDKNKTIDESREKVFEKYAEYKNPFIGMRKLMGNVNWMDHIDKANDILEARKTSPSAYANSRVEKNLIGKSNGETAVDYFVNQINEPGLYLLDEPENSLSAIHQRELAGYLFESARFFGAQLVIATHSPFMLSIPEAKIYNLDNDPVCETYDWTILNNMKEYYQLFKEYSKNFEKNI